jgi:hypothetical protein
MNHVVAAKAFVTNVNIGGQIDPGEVAEVHRAVCVRKSGGNESSFVCMSHG